MDKKKIIKEFLHDVVNQDAILIREYFTKEASILWHCTNEHFNLEEYIVANCEYPGEWSGEIERMEEIGSTVISVARVWLTNESMSFHVTSFFEFDGTKIKKLEEYWGDDGAAPQWRLNKHIGKQIKIVNLSGIG
jgi:hypothetical protein